MIKVILAVVSLIFVELHPAQHATEVSEQKPASTDFTLQIEELLSILTKGEHSSELYANLAYAYYHEQDLAKAVLFYEKALKLDPYNKNISQSIEQVRSELPVQITDIPDFILIRWYRSISNVFSSTTWSVLQLILGSILFFFLYQWLFRAQESKSLVQWFILGLLILAIVMSGLFAFHRKHYEIGGYAGVSMAGQNIYEAPDDRSAPVVSIGPGNKVFILDEIGEWYKVQLRDKDSGWIKKDQLALI